MSDLQPIETIVVDGLALANELRDEMAREIAALAEAGHRPPQLTVVLVGDDPASRSYIKGKQRACAKIGADSAEYLLPESTSEKELLDLLDKLGRDDAVDGILVPGGFGVLVSARFLTCVPGRPRGRRQWSPAARLPSIPHGDLPPDLP